MIHIMSEDTTEIPVVESDQVEELSSARHSQSVLLKYEDDTVYMIMWDGEFLRLLLPLAADPETHVVAYKVLGHLEVSLPFPLDPVTMERQAMILVASYRDGLESDVTEEE